MSRTTNALVNFAVFFAAGYAAASRWRDRDAGVRVGAAIGLVGAAVSWIGYEKPDALESNGDDGEPIEIEI